MGISNSVSEFEKVFEDMEVKTGEMDAALENVYSASIDQQEVNSLLNEISDSNVIGMQGQIGAVGKGAI